MFKILKSSVRDTVIYSIGTFSTKLAGFVLVPLYTNRQYLLEAQYGNLNLIEANLQIVISVFGLGLCYAFERWYWDPVYVSRRKSMMYTVLLATIIIGIVLIGASWPLSTTFSEWLLGSADYGFVLQLMVINASLEIIAQTPNSLLRLAERPGLYTAANLAKLCVSLTLTVVLVAGYSMGLEGIYYAQIAGCLVYFSIISNFMSRHLSVGFERDALGQMIRFRLPFLLPVIALNVFNFNDRFVLNDILGPEQTGVYSLGAKLANTIRVFLITAVWLALMPTVYKMMSEPGHKRFYSKIMTYLGFAIMLAVLGMSFFSRELVAVLATDPAYWGAAYVIPVVSLGIFFSLLKDVSMIGINVSKKTQSVATTTIGISFLNLALNYLLVSQVGLMGAAYASLTTQVIFFVITYKIAQKHYEIPYELKKIGLMIVVATGLFLVTLLSEAWPRMLRLTFKTLLLAAFPVVLYFLKFYEPIELERLRGFWMKWRDPRKLAENIRTFKV